jgi:hypothetical protein
MSKHSRRPNREQIKAQRKENKRLAKELWKQEAARGIRQPAVRTIANGTCEYQTVEEEQDGRVEIVTEQAKIFRSQLPLLLRRFKNIPDPRKPKKTKHKITVLMIYGILTFVFQMSSRREANREMTRPMFVENLKLLFPDLETIPHHDTLMRLLSRIDVNEIESAHLELIRRLIRNKKFNRYLIDNCYPIAIDGTQKFTRYILWDEECLAREIHFKDKVRTQYYVYVLEANLAFYNGMTIPLMSEFLSYAEGDDSTSKQDCEQKAFKRLASRLKKEFPRLPILVLLDGLYPNGPIMEFCRKNKWQFMIVLQDKSLRSVWEEYNALKGLQSDNTLGMQWDGRCQLFEWVNDIEYYYDNNDRKMLKLHVVTCEENWKEIDKNTGKVVNKNSRHVWISSKPLTKRNVHEQCNLGARHRWGIETGILIEKHCGYHYEHCHSYDWNAMKGYHYLMRLGRLFNVLTQHAERLAKAVKTLGMRGLIRFIRETISGPWLDSDLIRQRLSGPIQLRLE